MTKSGTAYKRPVQLRRPGSGVPAQINGLPAVTDPVVIPPLKALEASLIAPGAEADRPEQPEQPEQPEHAEQPEQPGQPDETESPGPAIEPEQDGEPEPEQPVQPEQAGQAGSDVPDLMARHSLEITYPSLDDDPNTSLVPSLSLHMLSEHGVGGALHLDDDALREEHRRLHAEFSQDHGVTDWRFRPGRALDASRQYVCALEPVTTSSH